VYKAAVLGAAGYAGIEVVRYLSAHPEIEPIIATSTAEAGRALAELYPALIGSSVADLTFTAPDIERIADECDVAFLAVPHTAALDIAPKLIAAGLRVFDLSADYRLKNPTVYEQWYNARHTSEELLQKAVYGLPELHGDELAALAALNPAKEPVLVACPGCYPTASILALAPALAAGLASGAHATVNALSGISGAGKSLKDTSHFCSADEAVMAYAPASHRHSPEIDQELTKAAGREIHATFTPHLVPMKRGLLSTVTIPLGDSATKSAVLEAYAAFFEGKPFAYFVGERMPSTNEVAGTNNAHIGIAIDEASNTLIASAAIDNLGKGAASQSIQCANIVLGLDETSALKQAYPVV
jgi:N-acetyl-gamma-glutamyl-phosphate reductase